MHEPVPGGAQSCRCRASRRPRRRWDSGSLDQTITVRGWNIIIPFIAGEILAADANEAMQMKNIIAKTASVDLFVEEEEENIIILFLLVVCIK